MDFLEIIGLAAAVLTTAANIPQAVKMIRTHSTKSISTATYALLLTGFILWIIYGIKKDDLPIILANGVSALIATIILTMKIIAKKDGSEEKE